MLTSFVHISVDIMPLPETMMAVVVHGKGEQFSFCLTIAIKVEKAIDDLNNLNHILDYWTIFWIIEPYYDVQRIIAWRRCLYLSLDLEKFSSR